MTRPGSTAKTGRALRSDLNEDVSNSRSQAFERNRFAREHTITIRPSRAVCTYIPKNACSTLRYSILRANGVNPDPGSPAFHDLDVSAFRSTPEEIASAPYTFIILRCPYRRLVSMFVDKMLGSGRGLSILLAHDRLGSLAKWPHLLYLAEKFIRHSGMHAPARQHDICFRDVVKFLEIPGVLDLDHHWRPQEDFLIYESYDDIFRVENLQPVKDLLLDRIDFSLHDARALTRHGTEGANRELEGFFGDKPISVLAEMKRKGLVPAFRNFYDEDIRSRVARIYAGDIEIYGRLFGASELMFQEPGNSDRRVGESLRP
jgi:hypothetical protein